MNLDLSNPGGGEHTIHLTTAFKELLTMFRKQGRNDTQKIVLGKSEYISQATQSS